MRVRHCEFGNGASEATYCQSLCMWVRCSSLDLNATWQVLQVNGCVDCGAATVAMLWRCLWPSIWCGGCANCEYRSTGFRILCDEGPIGGAAVWGLVSWRAGLQRKIHSTTQRRVNERRKKKVGGKCSIK